MFGLYIHIPYCRSKCRYCDFYSTPCPDGVPEAYIDALCREMDRFSPCGSTPLRPDTLYFGGGTPSLLTPAQVSSAPPGRRPVRRSRSKPTPRPSRPSDWPRSAGPV